MNIQSEKLKLIQWLAALQDQSVVEKLIFIRDHLAETTENDWWDTLSEAERASVDRGLKDIENGKTIPHSEIRKKYEKWL